MILMALDHVRFFFTNAPFPPEAIEKTYLSLFLTRWVTHFCAPAFFFLAGTAAYLRRRRTGGDVSLYLVQRGVMLIALELTIVGFAWCFRPGYNFGGVIWSLGWSMILLAAVSRMRTSAVLALGSVIVAGHHVLESISAPASAPLRVIWHVLYVPGNMTTPLGQWFILFPIIPWCGVMFAGYATGALYDLDAERRRRMLGAIGSAATLLFVLLRVTNWYGNPAGSWIPGGSGHFEVQRTAVLTVIELLNTEKYPASLQYLLMTLGPTLVALGLMERRLQREAGRVHGAIVLFGRVPLFYYIAHLYLIHLFALVAAHVDGQPAGWLGWYGQPDRPRGYGYGLVTVYLWWLATIAALYPLCRWYEGLRKRSRNPILQYV